ncbi:hypothetical protein [Curtobacterium sp. Leaf261]|uniref:hypothetical protein n=1 Tax=Curtobacterium sp. Leaf261 TaxID=1736311 RepID=UPI000A61C929|nr:hypothetical protein [Curtobacterium sp. Leaf261]
MTTQPRDDQFHWTKQSSTRWRAEMGHDLVGIINQGAQFDVTSTNGALTGNHLSLDAAMAQVEAWGRWCGSAA